MSAAGNPCHLPKSYASCQKPMPAAGNPFQLSGTHASCRNPCQLQGTHASCRDPMPAVGNTCMPAAGNPCQLSGTHDSCREPIPAARKLYELETSEKNTVTATVPPVSNRTVETHSDSVSGEGEYFLERTSS